MGLELARAYVRVQGDSSGLRADLNAVRAEVDSSMRSIAAGAAGLLAGFAARAGGIISQGLESAKDFEQTQIQMETMLGSAQEANETLAKLTKFAVDTPFEMPGITQVATELIQFGERGEELMETLKILGDASGGTASKFQILGAVFNQIRGAVTLNRGDFKQLSTRGIISLQDIAKHYKVTTAEANNMLSRGKITFQEFRKILKSVTEEGGRMAGMAKRQSVSMEGLKSTLKDSVNIAIRMLATPLVPYLKNFYAEMIKVANAVEAFVRNGGQMVSFAFAGATAFASLGTSIMGVVFAANLLGISLKKALIGSGVGILIIALGAGVGYLVGRMMEAKSVTDAFGEAWEKLKTAVQPAIDAFNQFVENNKEKLDELRNTFGEIMDNLTDIVINFVNNAINFFASMVGSSIGSITEFANYVIDALGGILDWLSLMTTDWSLTWEYLKTNTAIVFLEIADKAAMAFNSMVGVVVGVGAGIWSVMKDTGNNIAMLFSALVQSLKGLFMGLWEAIKAGIKGKGLSDIGEAFMNEFAKQIAAIEGEATGLGKMGENAASAFNEGFVGFMGPDSPFAGAIGELEADAEKIRREMEQERWKKRIERGGIAAPEIAKPGEIKKPGVPSGDAKSFALEAGRYSFSEIGNKLQDVLLKKDKDNIGKQQVEIGKKGLAKQDELLKATKENKPTGTLTAKD